MLLAAVVVSDVAPLGLGGPAVGAREQATIDRVTSSDLTTALQDVLGEKLEDEKGQMVFMRARSTSILTLVITRSDIPCSYIQRCIRFAMCQRH